jgi:hypothetical protein
LLRKILTDGKSATWLRDLAILAPAQKAWQTGKPNFFSDIPFDFYMALRRRMSLPTLANLVGKLAKSFWQLVIEEWLCLREDVAADDLAGINAKGAEALL